MADEDMMRSPRPEPPPSGRDSPGPGWGPSLGFLAAALAVAAGGMALLLNSSPSTPSTPAAPVGEAAPAAPVLDAAAPAASTAPVPRARAASARPVAAPASTMPRPYEPGVDTTPDLSHYVASGEAPTVNQVIDRLHQAGLYGGIGAFSPPGTRPPLVGLAVPEDFALPPGYVRHYQATDDGQRIEPILMFSPDYQFFDANHEPIAIPKDRVVTPELAPPGLPIRRIVIPAPVDAGGSGN